MSRVYRKRRRRTTETGAEVIDKAVVLGGRVNIKVPVSLAEVIDGVSEEVERLTGEPGLLIMKAVMDAEVESLAGPKGKHDCRQSTRSRGRMGPRTLHP